MTTQTRPPEGQTERSVVSLLWGAIQLIELFQVHERTGGRPSRYTYAVKGRLLWTVGLHLLHDTTQAQSVEVGVQFLILELSMTTALWPSLP